MILGIAAAPDGRDDGIELPPLNAAAPARLLVMLHGAGSGPGELVPAALAWQLKLRRARVLLLRAPFDAGTPARRFWADPACYPVTAQAIRSAAEHIRPRIETARRALGLDRGQVCVIGFSQGASVALELAFGPEPAAALIIGYAARLYRLPNWADRIDAAVHLLHGVADSVVPSGYGEAAYRRLRAAGARVSLDLQTDEGHAVGQHLINRGTQFVMDWIFGRGLPEPGRTAH